jgi:hypothetical protein
MLSFANRASQAGQRRELLANHPADRQARRRVLRDDLDAGSLEPFPGIDEELSLVVRESAFGSRLLCGMEPCSGRGGAREIPRRGEAKACAGGGAKELPATDAAQPQLLGHGGHEESLLAIKIVHGSAPSFACSRAAEAWASGLGPVNLTISASSC